MEAESKANKTRKLKAKTNLRSKCSVSGCFCSTNGAYFPNPFSPNLTPNERKLVEEQLKRWILFCNRPAGWYPIFKRNRFQEVIGWSHFSPNDFTEHKRPLNAKLNMNKNWKPVTRKLKSGAVPAISKVVTKEERIRMSLGSCAEESEQSSVETVFKEELKQRRDRIVKRRDRLTMTAPVRRLNSLLESERKLRKTLESEIGMLTKDCHLMQEEHKRNCERYEIMQKTDALDKEKDEADICEGKVREMKIQVEMLSNHSDTVKGLLASKGVQVVEDAEKNLLFVFSPTEYQNLHLGDLFAGNRFGR